MNLAMFIPGLLIVGAVLVDVIWTSMWIGGGAGPITRSIGNIGWRAFKRAGRLGHGLMVLAGPAILTFTVLSWLLLLWLGWFLMFSSEAGAVVATSSGLPADTTDRIYFVGYTLFTLGNGDFAPEGGGWQVATALTAGSGLFTATLAITYLLSVISAAVSARAFATEVFGLGATPADAVAAGWDGASYASLAFPLQSLGSQLSKLSQQYLAYPVFQYFHSDKAETSPIVALARLDQILMISAHGVPEDSRAPRVLHNAVRSAVESVLDSLPNRFSTPAEEPLPPPDVSGLRRLGCAVVAEDVFRRAVEAEEGRRRKLLGLLTAHGWSAEDVS